MYNYVRNNEGEHDRANVSKDAGAMGLYSIDLIAGVIVLADLSRIIRFRLNTTG